MAAYLQWRRFVFFDREVVKEPPGPEGSAGKPFALPPGVTVCDSGRGSLVFGDIRGEVAVLGAPALRGGLGGPVHRPLPCADPVVICCRALRCLHKTAFVVGFWEELVRVWFRHARRCRGSCVVLFFFYHFLSSSFVCLNWDQHIEGQIWFLPRSLQLTSFQAYKLRVTHLYQLKQHSILVSVGEDEEGINPLVSQVTKANFLCYGPLIECCDYLDWLLLLSVVFL